MKKEEFVTLMNRKLKVIKEEERKDIIDEYVNHIEMKVAEGKSEEEAIEGFGDIDEMVKEILDAYNIDPEHGRRSGDNFDQKLNHFMDRCFDWFQNFLGSFTSLDAEHVIRLVFEIFVIIILLALLHIPFWMVSSMGSSLLYSLLGYGIGGILAWFWRFIIGVVYFVLFCVVIINVITKRVQRFRSHNDTPIMDDFKESFNFQKAKEAVHRFTDGGGTTDSGPYDSDAYAYEKESQGEDTSDTTSTSSSSSYQYSYDSDNYKASSTMGSTASTILTTIMKFFGFLFMIPFVCLSIGLYCLLGLMIVFSFQGFTLWGAYFIVGGAIIGVSGVSSFLYRTIFKGGKW